MASKRAIEGVEVMARRDSRVAVTCEGEITLFGPAGSRTVMVTDVSAETFFGTAKNVVPLTLESKGSTAVLLEKTW